MRRFIVAIFADSGLWGARDISVSGSFSGLVQVLAGRD